MEKLIKSSANTGACSIRNVSIKKCAVSAARKYLTTISRTTSSSSRHSSKNRALLIFEKKKYGPSNFLLAPGNREIT